MWVRWGAENEDKEIINSTEKISLRIYWILGNKPKKNMISLRNFQVR